MREGRFDTSVAKWLARGKYVSYSYVHFEQLYKTDAGEFFLYYVDCNRPNLECYLKLEELEIIRESIKPLTRREAIELFEYVFFNEEFGWEADDDIFLEVYGGGMKSYVENESGEYIIRPDIIDRIETYTETEDNRIKFYMLPAMNKSFGNYYMATYWETGFNDLESADYFVIVECTRSESGCNLTFYSQIDDTTVEEFTIQTEAEQYLLPGFAKEIAVRSFIKGEFSFDEMKWALDKL